MIRLLADVNIEGHVARLIAHMQADPWREYWDYLGLRGLTFSEVGLASTDSDAVVWRRCQNQEIFLLTGNRNDDGPDSLEATIRAANSAQALPVFTIGDPDSILSSSEYADQVIDRLIRYLLVMDELRGTGRLYLP